MAVGRWKRPNPNARNMDTARELVAMSYELVGLEKGVKTCKSCITNFSPFRE